MATPAHTTSTPPPTSEQILRRTMAQAIVSTLSRKKANKFLRAWSDAVAAEARKHNVLNITEPHPYALVEARDGAVRLFRSELPTIIQGMHDGRK